MTTLKNASIKELEEELKRRAEEDVESLIPTQITDPNINNLKEVLDDVVDKAFKTNTNLEDEKNWVYETVMETFYGSDYFERLSDFKEKGYDAKFEKVEA